MSKLRIFVLEDDIIQVSKAEMAIEQLGYEFVGSTGRGEDALQLIGDSLPDLILVDIQLEGSKTGIDVIRELNEKNPLPAVIISSANDQGTFSEAATVNPSSFLVKPFDQGSLRVAIENAINEFEDPNLKST